MRRVVDVAILTAVLAAAGLVWSSRPQRAVAADPTVATQQALDRLYRRTSYRAALRQADAPEGADVTAWPERVLPEWFTGALPTNPLLPDAEDRPWLDLAPPGDDGAHPPDPVAYRPQQAQFWYNPRLGVFRARLSADLGENRALALYNRVHGVDLPQLPRHADPARTPRAHTTPTARVADRIAADGEIHGVAPSTPADPAPPRVGETAAASSIASFIETHNPDPEAPSKPPPARRARARLSD